MPMRITAGDGLTQLLQQLISWSGSRRYRNRTRARRWIDHSQSKYTGPQNKNGSTTYPKQTNVFFGRSL